MILEQKNSGFLKGKNIKREVTTSLFNNDKNIALNESVTPVQLPWTSLN